MSTRFARSVDVFPDALAEPAGVPVRAGARRTLADELVELELRRVALVQHSAVLTIHIEVARRGCKSDRCTAVVRLLACCAHALDGLARDRGDLGAWQCTCTDSPDAAREMWRSIRGQLARLAPDDAARFIRCLQRLWRARQYLARASDAVHDGERIFEVGEAGVERAWAEAELRGAAWRCPRRGGVGATCSCCSGPSGCACCSGPVDVPYVCSWCCDHECTAEEPRCPATGRLASSDQPDTF